MFNYDLFVDFFIALLALLNPFLAIPLFLGLTGDYSAGQRQRTAAVTAFAIFVALIVAAVIGDQLLGLFGVHTPAFKIAGGLIVLTIALGMLKDSNDDDSRVRTVIETRTERPGKSIAIYPLAIPLLAGPGAFVTTIVFSSRVAGVGDFLTFGAAILAIVLINWLAMASTQKVARFISETAINIVTKVLGILLAAVSVEMILAGVDEHFLPLYGLG
ncbi:MAG TPA: NAAT family transporter [Xanthomonadales bacterium]|nr:NAAT family transporter [Xanthomonadales bacterium]